MREKESLDCSKPCDLCRDQAIGATNNKLCRECSLRESLLKLALKYPISVEDILERLKVGKKENL